MRLFKKQILISLLLQVYFIGVVTFGAFSQVSNPDDFSEYTLYYSIRTVQIVEKSNNDAQEASDETGQTFNFAVISSTSTVQNSYLIPFIISQIDTLTEFKKVSFLPSYELTDSNAYEEVVGEKIYKMISSKPFKIRKVENPYKVRKPPLSSPYLLLEIKLDRFDKFIEYQFRLSDSNSKPIRESSFFINPDDPNYQNTISLEIQRLFDDNGGKNKPPKAKIRIDGKLVESDAPPFYRSNLDTIYLDGLSSFDDATPKSLLKYRWTVEKVVNSKNVEAYLPDFNFEDSKQKLVIKEGGEYKFSLQVSDGVALSEEDNIKIHVQILKKPIIELNTKYFKMTFQNNLVFNKFSEREVKSFDNENKIEFSFKEYDKPTLDSNDLVLKYIYSIDRSKKFFDLPQTENKKTTNKNSGNRNDSQTEDSLTGNQGKSKFFTSYEYLIKNHYNSDDEVAFIPGDTLAVVQLDRSLGFNHTIPSGTIRFRNLKAIKPGTHKFLFYSVYKKDVKSNIDTVHIQYKEKSMFLFYTGFDRYWVKKAREDYQNGINLNTIKFGGRLYVTQRLSLDAVLMFLLNYINLDDTNNDDVGITNLTFRINYDFYPFRSKDLHTGDYPTYITAYLSSYQLNLTNEDDKLAGYRQYGLGAEFRIQLFESKPKFGVFYLAFDVAFYTQLAKSPYYSPSFGVNFIYGFSKY